MDFSKPIDTSIKSDKEKVGGSYLVDSGVYICEIAMAFMDISAGGANCFKVELRTNTGATVNEAFWVTNKKGEVFYVQKDTGKKIFLPGYQMANRLCTHAIGMDFPSAGAGAEAKVIQIYDPAAKKKVDKEMGQVFTNLIGAKVLVAILRKKENKRVKNVTGTYVNSADTIERNYVEQVFNPTTGMTVTEIKNGTKNPEFIAEWKKKYEGKTINDVKEADPSLASSAEPAADAPSPFAS